MPDLGAVSASLFGHDGQQVVGGEPVVDLHGLSVAVLGAVWAQV